MEFERAAALRDRIRALTNVQANQGINPEGVEEADVVALHQEGGQACVQVFFIRAHQNWGNRAYFPRTGSGAEPGEILEAFLGQFYGNKTPPRLILASHAARQRRPALPRRCSTQLGRRVTIAAAAARREGRPRRAGRAQRPRGAGAADGREREPGARCSTGSPRPSGSTGRPSGSRSTTTATSWARTRSAAMIVAGPEGFLKSQYRKFNIRGTDLTPGDDFGMMREVLTRRFARLAKEDPDRQSGAWPDLVLIDGGAGQVAAACAALRRARHRRGGGGRRRQGRRPRRRQGGVPPPGPAADGARAPRPGALLRPAAARRGPPLRDRRAPARSARRRPGRRRSTRCRGSARRASARCSRISARPRR